MSPARVGLMIVAGFHDDRVFGTDSRPNDIGLMRCPTMERLASTRPTVTYACARGVGADQRNAGVGLAMSPFTRLVLGSVCVGLFACGSGTSEKPPALSWTPTPSRTPTPACVPTARPYCNDFCDCPPPPTGCSATCSLCTSCSPTATTTSIPIRTPTRTPFNTPTCAATPTCPPFLEPICLHPDPNGCPTGCGCDGPATPMPAPSPCFESVGGCCDFGGRRACYQLREGGDESRCKFTDGGNPIGCAYDVTCNSSTGRCEPVPTPSTTPPRATATPTVMATQSPTFRASPTCAPMVTPTDIPCKTCTGEFCTVSGHLGYCNKFPGFPCLCDAGRTPSGPQPSPTCAASN